MFLRRDRDISVLLEFSERPRLRSCSKAWSSINFERSGRSEASSSCHFERSGRSEACSGSHCERSGRSDACSSGDFERTVASKHARAVILSDLSDSTMF